MTAPTTQPGAQSDDRKVPPLLPVLPSGVSATALAAGQYMTLTAAVKARVRAYLAAHWSQLTSWRDADADAFVRTVVPIVKAGQQQVSMLTDAYLGQMYEHMTGEPAPHAANPLSDVTGAALRDGAQPEDIYQRPFQTVWWKLSQGESLSDAVKAGADRLDVTGQTDMQLAATHTARAVMRRQPHVVGYRRVLTNPEACGLCILASTQRYHRADLMPIHPRCDCAVAPIIGDNDPGRTINSAMLTHGSLPLHVNDQQADIYGSDNLIDLGDLGPAVHKAIKDTFGRSASDGRKIDYRKVVLVTHHDEIGPMLTVSHHHFSQRQIDSRDLAAKPKRPTRSR